MSKQSDSIPEVVEIVSRCGVSVGLILGGSVAQGRERHDSDVDFFAIADAPCQPDFTGFSLIWEKDGQKLFECRTIQIPIQIVIACWTVSSMDEILQTKPYMMYPLLLGQTVHDPDGIARRYLARIEKYFRSRPRLEEAWGRQLQELRDAKSNPSLKLRFPDPYDFARHVENTYTKEIAEQ